MKTKPQLADRFFHHVLNDFGYVVERTLLYGSCAIVAFRILSPAVPDWLVVGGPVAYTLFAAKRRAFQAAASYGFRQALRIESDLEENPTPRPQQWPTTGRI